MIGFILMKPGVDLGYLPEFLSEDDPRSAKEQINQNYKHGGGWSPLDGWVFDPSNMSIKYPGDPALKPLAAAVLHKEKLYFYPHAWLAIVQSDGTYEIARID